MSDISFISIEELEKLGYFQEEESTTIWETSSKLKKLPHYLGLDFTRGNYAYLYSTKNRQWRTQTKKSITTSLLDKHLRGEITVALPLYPYSKYLIIDIDNRSQYKDITATDVFNQIVQDFGNPAYYEFSSSSKGYHLYYHMNEYITDNAKKEIEFRYMYKNRMAIEVLQKNKKIRLPYSAQYQNNAFDKFGTQITNFEHLYNNFENMYTNPFYTTKLPTWVKKLNKHGVNIAKKREIALESNKDRTYGCGTRHIEQINIGFDTIREKGNFQDFINNCEYWNNGTSKDMMASDTEKHQMLEKIWNWCIMHFSETPEYSKGAHGVMVNEFGQEEIINAIEWTFNDSQRSKMEKALTFYYRYYNVGKKKGKKEKEFVNGCLLIIEEIISKKLHDKTVDSKYETNNSEINSKLSQGTLFNYELKKRITKKLQVKNYRKTWNFLEKIGFIQPVKINGFTYSYKSIRYAKHYTIMNINTFFNRYTKIKAEKNPKKEKNTGLQKNINYVVNFFELTDGRLSDRLLKVRMWKQNRLELFDEGG